jgi:hypothetical protein
MTEENTNYNANLLFIAQDTLQEIREKKKDQQAITLNFVVITGVLIGLFEVLKSKFNVQSPNISIFLKIVIIAYGSLTTYLLIRFQHTLSNYRKRISAIWDDKSFKFAFKMGTLKYKYECKELYYSFWNNFWGYTFLYILLVVLITLLICFLL